MADLRSHDVNPLPVSDDEDGGEHDRLSRRRKPRGRGVKEHHEIDEDDKEMLADSQRQGLLANEEPSVGASLDPPEEASKLEQTMLPAQLEEEIPKDAALPEAETPEPSEKEVEEMGEEDSDDDEEQRVLNMTNPDKRRFNEHDIVGDLDRDSKGDVEVL